MADSASAANPRYLVPFHPKRIPHHFVDVLIVGGGIAGLRAAMACDPRLTVLIVTKDHRRESNSSYAQGGIAGVLDPAGRFRQPCPRHPDRRRWALRSGDGRDGRPRGATPHPAS